MIIFSYLLHIKDKMTNTYQKTHSLEKRLLESSRIRQKYPDRIPVIVEKLSGSSISTLDQSKFLVPDSLTMSQFIYVLRKRIKLHPHEAIYVFINDLLPSTSETLNMLYKVHGNQDGFLYMTYGSENTFG